MHAVSIQPLTGIPETLLIPLFARADSGTDPAAEDIVRRLDDDITPYGSSRLLTQIVRCRTRLLDRMTRTFLGENPDAQVVTLGAGLCTRLSRVDNGQARWLDVDLPEVAEIRSTLLPAHHRQRIVGASVMKTDWHAHVDTRRPLLFIAEGLLIYFEPAEVYALLSHLAERYPGATFLVENSSPLATLWPSPSTWRLLKRLRARPRWLPWTSRAITAAVPALRVIAESFHLDDDPTRWGPLRWLRWLRPVRTVMRITALRAGG